MCSKTCKSEPNKTPNFERFNPSDISQPCLPEKPSKQLKAEIVPGDSIFCNSTHPPPLPLFIW